MTLTKLDCLFLTNEAFDAYAASGAKGADLAKLTEYEALKPLLMPMKVFTQILLLPFVVNCCAKWYQRSGIAFFRSTVITGQIDNKSNGDTDQNQPKNVKTRWVDTEGKPLAPEETGKDFKVKKRLMATVSVNHVPKMVFVLTF